MPVDVELPNGVIYANVPDDVAKNKHQVAMMAIKEGIATNADFGYGEVKQDKATFLEGMGAGFMNTGRQVGNILGLVDDDVLDRQSEIDEGLGGWGKAGKLTGEIAATLPIGGGVGAGGKALGRSVLAARRAGNVGKRPARALANTLQSRVGRGAVEGSAVGALYGGPDNRAAGAAMGAGFGAGAGAIGSGLAKMGKNFRLTDISDEAKELQRMTGQFIPLSQSAKPGVVKQVYNALLANIPGVGGKLRGQYKEALDDVRKFAAEQAMPDTSIAHQRVGIKAGDNLQTIFDKLKSFWDKAYEPIEAATISLTAKYIPKAPPWLSAVVNKASRGTVKLPEELDGVVTTGKTIRDLQKFINQVVIPDEKSPAVQKTLREYVESLDTMMERNFPKGTQVRGVWEDYISLRDPYRNWVDLQSAAAGAVAKKFKPGSLARKAQRGTQGLPSENQTILQKTGELGNEALEDFPSRLGLFQTVAALALTGAGGAAAGVPGAMVVPSAMAIGRGMITPGFQKLISGQSEYMKQHAKKLLAAGYTTRQIAAILGAQDAT
jgi:hypothetical protein